MMDYAAINVILLDDRAHTDRFESGACAPSSEPKELLDDVRCLLSVFNGVHVLRTGSSCLTRTALLDSVTTDCNPVFVFLPVTGDLQPGRNPGSARNSQIYGYPSTAISQTNPKKLSQASGDEEIHGLALLKHIVLEISERHFSKLIVPIAVVDSSQVERVEDHYSGPPLNCVSPAHAIRCIEMGAVDVVSSPLDPDHLRAMSTLAYRAHIEGTKARPAFLELKKSRKLSWVGVDEERPYAYLREVMVSTLMSGICKPEIAVSKPASNELYKIPWQRARFVEDAIGTWAFPAHDLADDELVHAGYLMLQHALAMPELAEWRLPSDDLKHYLTACKSAYNSFVLYHNFRHVIDVLQAIFYFLVQIGTLPPYPANSRPAKSHSNLSSIELLLTPFEAFVLLVTAIGHDVGHPGVNNAFLVALKAPLAQLYNDNSVLEAFHCAAYSQILRRYWPAAYNSTRIRSLLIKSILATDMQLHFKYMTDLGNLQQKLAHNGGTDGWAVKDLEDYKTLACGLLIKCADISNVARPFPIASAWSSILQLEFACQGEMESRVGIETTLFGGPPELGNLTKLANSQIGFMNIFAHPLFEAVADILPSMTFAGEEITANKSIWQEKIEEEKYREEERADAERYSSEGFHSPRSGSPDRLFFANTESNAINAAPELSSHPEGLPATGSIPTAPRPPPMSTSQGTLDPTPKNGAGAFSSGVSSSHASQQGLASAPGATTNTPSYNSSLSSDPSSTSSRSPLFHASSPASSHQAFSTRATTATTTTPNAFRPSAQASATDSPSFSPSQSQHQSQSQPQYNPHSTRSYSGNFSRPMSTSHSHHHSANTSFAGRSSAPSGAASTSGAPSTSFLPTSPTGTQATSLFENASASDGAVDADVDADELEDGQSGDGTGPGIGDERQRSRSDGSDGSSVPGQSHKNSDATGGSGSVIGGVNVAAFGGNGRIARGIGTDMGVGVGDGKGLNGHVVGPVPVPVPGSGGGGGGGIGPGRRGHSGERASHGTGMGSSANGNGNGNVHANANAGSGALGHREVRRKSSRFRFDFWKKKRSGAGEVSP